MAKHPMDRWAAYARQYGNVPILAVWGMMVPLEKEITETLVLESLLVDITEEA